MSTCISSYAHFALLLFALPCAASDVAVLIDVSGTMGHYGAWQEDARTLVSSVLSGNPREMGWQREGNAIALPDFALRSGDRVHLVKFGSVVSTSFPYFKPEQTSSTPADFENSFPLSPSDYVEARTNKPLAIAVGSRLSADSAGTARLIVISDFLVDSDLNAEQQRFVNAFDSKVQTQSPVIYSWSHNPHLQVKLISNKQVTTSSSQVTQSPPDDIAIRLSGAKVFESPKRVDFSWSLNKDLPDVTYSITVQNPRAGTVVFSRSRILASSVLWPSPDAGNYVWRVTANLPNDQTISSASAPLTVPSDSMGPTLAGVAALGALGGAVWWYSRRRVTKARLHTSPEQRTTWKT